MRKTRSSVFVFVAFFSSAIFMVCLLTTCGGGGGGGGTSTGTVTTSISDPPTCQTSFQNVWVTITRVRAHISSGAGPNDSGWVELVDLRNAPMQIDLMNLSQTECVLTQLQSTGGIPAGQYQQIRLYLLSNNPSAGTTLPNPNHCATANAFNCVVTSGGTQILQLSSEGQTGIKIPSGQIAGGQFTVPAGQVVDLDIDFDACSSIVQDNGQFRLKPVLHAAEVSLNNAINGIVVDSASGSPIPGAVVFLEQQDSSGIDRMVMQTLTELDGAFIFCPVPAGNFDVVADALIGGVAYNTTITFSVPSGTTMGRIPIVAEIGANASAAKISGQVTAVNAGGSATTADINLSALQKAGAVMVTIPPLGDPTMNVTTDGGSASYTLIVPASNPQFGTFRASPPTAYTPPSMGSVIYWVNAQAFVPTLIGFPNPGDPDCTPSSLPPSFDTNNQLTVVPDSNITGENFTFIGCE